MRTPLFETHKKAGGRIVGFHGWEMPVWYTGIKEEHLATRNACGLFDVSHMGEIYMGPGPLETLITIDASSMEKGRVRYTFLLNEKGGIIDDLTIYCIEPDKRYMLCVNASNLEKDLEWIKENSPQDAAIQDQSKKTAMLALQGPGSFDILKKTLGFDLKEIGFYHFTHKNTAFGRLMISHTGYTGEPGVEIFMDTKKVKDLWQAFTEARAIPCGLGARDTLRLEMGYPLHGNDIDEQTTPFEAGLGFAVDMNKAGFIGKKALQQGTKPKRVLKGIEMLEKGIPRPGYICTKDGLPVGRITSGSISPVLNKGIALCYIDAEISGEVKVQIRSKEIRALVTKPPFVKV
ncbi:MAG: glycine cleavage system aminomethyltransferase GcvT [Thermodesulfobacteriota bacterium]|nr:glycine cleavage system aminomethyltransferase GcvT [Thermodesulfobacteriota bacterium]